MASAGRDLAGVQGIVQLAALNQVLASSPSTKGAAKPSACNPGASKLSHGLEPKDTSYPISAKA